MIPTANGDSGDPAVGAAALLRTILTSTAWALPGGRGGLCQQLHWQPPNDHPHPLPPAALGAAVPTVTAEAVILIQRWQTRRRRRRRPQPGPSPSVGERPQYKIALVAMLTFCLIIRKHDHQKFRQFFTATAIISLTC